MKKQVALLIFSFFILAGCVNLGSQENAKPQKTLGLMVCEYDSEDYLTCGSSWTIVSEGVEYNLQANEPLSIGRNKLIGIDNPENSDETFLLYTITGTFELSKETTRRAVGYQITGPPPN